ncbi:Conserved_hypothetical protein [Hexamita inflata]|uniref:Uncharacterized protein n=1 Tax=Hexamita inflata TaxID=28002 RepID=A0ABP1HBK3_9EUKA
MLKLIFGPPRYKEIQVREKELLKNYLNSELCSKERIQINIQVKQDINKLKTHIFDLNHEKLLYPSIAQQEAQITTRKEELDEMSRNLFDLCGVVCFCFVLVVLFLFFFFGFFFFFWGGLGVVGVGVGFVVFLLFGLGLGVLVFVFCFVLFFCVGWGELKRSEEEQERTKKNQEAKKQELVKIQNEERRIQFYKKNCNQYIDEIANQVGDDELAEYLEQIMESTKAQFEQTKLPQPEQWRERLNNEANLYNRSRLEKRIQELQREIVKIEAKLYVSWNEFQREQNQNKMNHLLKIKAQNRHNMEIYEKNQLALKQFSTLKNLEQLMNDQKAIDEAEHQKKLEVYNEKVQKRAAELQKKDEEEKSKKAEIEKAEKLAKLAKMKAMKQAAMVGVEQAKVNQKGTVTIEAPKEPQRPAFTNTQVQSLQRPNFFNKIEEQFTQQQPFFFPINEEKQIDPRIDQPQRQVPNTKNPQPKNFRK